MKNKNGKFLKGECNKCVKYGHIVSDFWGDSNKGNEKRNGNNNRKPPFNGECNNCGKRGQREVDCCD